MPAKYKFTAAERFAVKDAHKHICFLCRLAFEGYRDWDVDHLIAESTAASELAELRESLALPPDFDVNSFENWVPAHHACNRRKGSLNYNAPIFLTYLNEARKAAPLCRKKAEAFKRTPAFEKLIADLETHGEELLSLPENQTRILDILTRYSQPTFAETTTGEVHELAFTADKSNAFPLITLPVSLTPGWSVSDSNGHVIYVRHESGRFGYTTSDPRPDASWFCGTCGQTGTWNGARCMRCGMFQDD